MSEENKEIVRRFFQAEERADWPAVQAAFAPDYTGHFRGQATTPESGLQYIKALHAGFPDWTLTVEDMVAEGDKVVARVTIRGTHKGEFEGVPPSGNPVTIEILVMWRLTGGKLAEAWVQFDIMALMQQIGATPARG